VVLSGAPASSTTKTGRHDIAEILLKVALSTNKSTIAPPIMFVINDIQEKTKINDVH
jgi:hypothetical protein